MTEMLERYLALRFYLDIAATALGVVAVLAFLIMLAREWRKL